MTNFTPEMIEEAKKAQNVQQLLALAKEKDVELTEQEAQAFFEQLHTHGELSDDELDMVSGGGCKSAVAETFNIDDHVRIRPALSNCCERCKGRTGYYIRYSDSWCVLCDRCNDGITKIVYFNNSTNPAAFIEKI